MKRLVIYHGGACADGFCAAWLFKQAFSDAEFVAAQYGEPPPDVVGKDVFIVDFSYKLPAMREIVIAANSVVVLDHHKTAEKELESLVNECAMNMGTKDNVPFIKFDMSKSGGRLAWEYLKDWANGRFNPLNVLVNKNNGDSPWIVDYTEDRDLWKWTLPESHAVNAALRSYPLDFDRWNQLADRDPMSLAIEGHAILRREAQIVDQHVRNANEIELDGHKVLTCNATILQSEIGEALAQGRPFSATWLERADGAKVYSLRSRGETGIDVSEVAAKHGGGGHRNAAGFQVKAS
jgi:uncharacterized protein